MRATMPASGAPMPCAGSGEFGCVRAAGGTGTCADHEEYAREERLTSVGAGSSIEFIGCMVIWSCGDDGDAVGRGDWGLMSSPVVEVVKED